jgi:hypothetical protein
MIGRQLLPKWGGAGKSVKLRHFGDVLEKQLTLK